MSDIIILGCAWIAIIVVLYALKANIEYRDSQTEKEIRMINENWKGNKE